MKKILLISPYFGTLPKEYFQLILDSCLQNETINWLLITNDKTDYFYPSNVKVIYTSWSHFRNLVKKKIKETLKVDCVLDDPYKLCDYRPLYGMIFQKNLKNYDYWGNTDLTDVVYGDLRKFLTPKVLTYDKVNFLGHLTLYKNSKEVNERFTKSFSNGLNVKEILNSSENYAFDEAGKNGIQRIYEEYSYSFCRCDDMIADISPMRYAFQLSKFDSDYNQYYEKYRKRVFSYKDGKLIGWYKNKNHLAFKEYGYIHFQKRRMINKATSKDFLIIPGGFINYRDVSIDLVNEYAKRKIYMPFLRLKLKALIKRIRTSIN